jgi:hypothetical protein
MKVRLSESMIRFRLDRSEVGNLSSGKTLILSLASDTLMIRLVPIAAGTPTTNSESGMAIGIPQDWLQGWPDSDVVGFDFNLPAIQESGSASNQNALRVVVEKDFPCAHDGESPPDPVRMP